MNFKAWVLLVSAMTTACLPGTALSAGQTPLDLNLPSLGNPSRLDLDTRERVGERGELKHLSTHRKRK